MQGSSRAALAGVKQALADEPARSNGTVGAELLSVASLLGRESGLRNALTDNGSSGERRVQLARRVFGDKVSEGTATVLSAVVTQRWSHPRDLTEAIDTLGAEALLAQAEKDGRIDSVEEELFRFARVLESSADLQLLLSSPAVEAATKAAVIRDLLADRAQDETVTLVSHVAEYPGGEPVADRVEQLVRLAAERRQQLLADVRAPVPLTSDQQRRLSSALARIYGRDVSVAVSVDPQLMGGAIVRVGDEIIDGSIASRIAAARRSLTQ